MKILTQQLLVHENSLFGEALLIKTDEISFLYQCCAATH